MVVPAFDSASAERSDAAAERRVTALDWPRIGADLDARGYAVAGTLLNAGECAALRAAYAEPGLFRSRVVMSRHRFGRGEYQYFADPLPGAVAALRATLYRHLVPVANRWHERCGRADRYPPTHAEYRARCRGVGQTRPTPLLLRYGPDDYNCLHQDRYGDEVFPLQAAVLLSEPGVDFDGGEFVLTEQRPRAQSRVEVVPLARGEAVIFAVDERPLDGARGTYRVRMRHGVSRLRRGERYTLGLILHDAA